MPALEMNVGIGFQVKVTGNRALSFNANGGTLHGVWVADDPVSTSDGRRKLDIEELAVGLTGSVGPFASREGSRRSCMRGSKGPCDGVGSRPRGSLQEDGQPSPQLASSADAGTLGPLLRALRPVVYKYKEQAQSKPSRFGFIADELENTLPQVVRTYQGDQGKTWKGVVYQDFIAVLTAGLQEQMTRVDKIEGGAKRGGSATLQRKVKMLSSRVSALSSDLAKERETRRALETKVETQQATLNAQQVELTRIDRLETQHVDLVEQLSKSLSLHAGRFGSHSGTRL